MEKRIKLAMICTITNFEIRKSLKLRIPFFEYVIRKIKGETTDINIILGESSIWNANAIKEYEKYTDEIELHVIAPHDYLDNNCQEFVQRNIYYHFFRNDSTSILTKIKYHFSKQTFFSDHKQNRRYICKLINRVHPDIIQLIGAENPHLSLSALDLPRNIPLLVQLETLMNDPNFEKNFPISHDMWKFRAKQCELPVLKRADYIGTTVKRDIEYIRNYLIPEAVIVPTRLAVGEEIKYDKTIKKEYDFVYFSYYLEKAFDLALEAFAITYSKRPNITMHVTGGCSSDYMDQIYKRMEALGVANAISFTGKLPSHENVIKEIQKSKIALLPLKFDLTSNTIREAMACGLPVITTITKDGTSHLNDDRETVLLSEIGDHQALADNMLRLMENNTLYTRLQKAGFLLLQERYSNKAIITENIKIIKALINKTNE